jgi:hypothetical protein
MKAKSRKATVGPSVTLYEIVPEAGFVFQNQELRR